MTKLKKITYDTAVELNSNNSTEYINAYIQGYNRAVGDMKRIKKRAKSEQPVTKCNGLNDPFEWTAELMEKFNSWNPNAPNDKLLYDKLMKLSDHCKELFASQDRENKRLHDKITKLTAGCLSQVEENKHNQGIENGHISNAINDIYGKIEHEKIQDGIAGSLHNKLVGRVDKLEEFRKAQEATNTVHYCYIKELQEKKK